MKDKSTTKIFVIDNDPSDRKKFRRYFENHYFNVLEAGNGQEALDIIKKENFDLVLLDLRLPEINGLKLLTQLRKHSSNTPVVVTSEETATKDAVEALRLGAWDYFQKPMKDLYPLLHSIERALERSRLVIKNRKYQKHLKNALKESEKKFKTFMETVSDLMFISDNAGYFTYVNETMAQTLGYSKKEMIGMHVTKILNKESAKHFKHHFNTLVTKGKWISNPSG